MAKPVLKSGIMSLEPASGQLGFDKAKHLLNRCLFGARLSEINFIAEMQVEEALDFLLQTPTEEPQPPLSVKDTDDEVPIGTTWVTTKFNGKYRGQRMYSYNNWWFGRLLNQNVSLIEKMVLFWHNHFVIENDVVRNSNFNYRYNQLLFNQALGNFKNLTEEITINVGMLQYLDGVKNMAGSPNENFARELFELFTIGKGPLIEEGNYTNYTEHDIREASKVLTGWKTSSANDNSYFVSSKHDKSVKTFSEIFNNKSISNNEEQEYKDLIAMIFEKEETARFLVRKLYRWFVYNKITDEVESQIIIPLSDQLIEKDFEIKPVLKTLLSSNHFYDITYRGCMIKNPLEFTIGLIRQLEVDKPEENQLLEQYGYWNVIRNQARKMDMEIGNPPDVAGWEAWYLAPLYNQLWINTATIPTRTNFIKSVIYWGYRPIKGAEKVVTDPFKIAYLAKAPSDINSLLNTFIKLLLPIPLTEEQIVHLKEALIPGLPDFEWTVEWNKYVNHPEDENQKQAVANRLKNLLAKICSMAEYQLN